MQQLTFASLAYTSKKKKTRKERFLGKMESIVTWQELEAVIGPITPRRGRQPMPMRSMRASSKK